MEKPPCSIDDPNLVLDGGSSYNAIHIITGKEAHIAIPTNYNNIIRIDNKYQKGVLDDKFMLDKLKTNLVLIAYKENNADAAHIVSLYGIDDKNFYIIDSNRSEFDSDRSIKINAVSKEKMYKELTDIEFSDLSTNLTPEKTKPIRAKYEATKDVKSMLPAYYFK